MNMSEIAKKLQPVKGQRLAGLLQRFLAAKPEDLAKWHGTWTEVNTAKVVEILRKRGLIEEHEASHDHFDHLVNACYRTKVFVPNAGSEEGARNP